MDNFQNPEIKYRKSFSKIGNYELIKTIGEGTFGKVKLAKNIQTSEYVAIKILEKSKINDKDDLNNIMKEIKYLKKLNHINIISLYEIIETEQNYYIIMEYAENELFSYIVEKNYLNEEIASFFYIQILSSIEYIHKKKICHRDLKPENILLTNNNSIIKIIDFGLANCYKNKKNELLETSCGSPCYAAPEMILGKKYHGIDIDIWSSGIVLFAMVCGFLPFEDEDNENIYRKVVIGKYDLPDKLSDECKDLIQKILIGNPKKRIKIKDIKKHSFLKKGFLKMKNDNFLINYFLDNNKNEKFDKFDFNDFVIDNMLNLNIKGINCKEDIVNNLKNNNFNEITTIYKLLIKKIEREKFFNCNHLNTKLAKSKNDINENNLNEKSTSSIKTRESNYTNNIYKNNITKRNVLNNQSNEISKKNIIQNSINIENKEKEISSYTSKANTETLKINSFSFELHKNSNNYNLSSKRKIIKTENYMNNNNKSIKKGTIKTEKNFIQRYKQLLNSIKYSLTNRNVKKVIDTSLSIDRKNKNNLLFFPIPRKSILTSSNPNLTSANNLKLSFIPSNTINLIDKSSINHSKEKKINRVINNNNLKTHKKKSLSIITSSILTLEINKNINTIETINSHKRTTSNYSNNESKLNKKNIKKKNNSKEINLNLNINSSRSPNIKKLNNEHKNIIFTQINNNYLSNKKLKSSFNYNKRYNLFKDKIDNNKINKNKLLITTFINLSKNSKQKNQSNLNKEPNFANSKLKSIIKKSISNNLFMNDETKNKNSNKKKKYIKRKNTPSSLEKKIDTKNNNIILSLNKKNDFACCSSNLSNKEIIEKLNLLCEDKKYNLTSNDEKNYFINNNINNTENSISIEISTVNGKNILKMFHIKGNEKLTKEIIKNILMEIGF